MDVINDNFYLPYYSIHLLFIITMLTLISNNHIIKYSFLVVGKSLIHHLLNLEVRLVNHNLIPIPFMILLLH